MANIPIFGSLTGNEGLPDLIDRVAQLQKTVEWLLDGKLSSKNLREIGGWLVSNKELKSRDGTVGMSTENTAADDVRFWAGSADKNAAPWRVTKAGKMIATGALIQSRDGYPRAVLDPDNDLFGVYLDANNYIQVEADYGGTTSLNFVQDGNVRGRINTLLTYLEIMGPNGIGLNASGSAIFVDGQMRFHNFSDIYSTGATQSLQESLDQMADDIASVQVDLTNKADAGVETGSSGGHNHGIPDGTVLMVNGGGTVTFTAAGGHTHTQS